MRTIAYFCAPDPTDLAVEPMTPRVLRTPSGPIFDFPEHPAVYWVLPDLAPVSEAWA